jgi:hypothetical protein
MLQDIARLKPSSAGSATSPIRGIVSCLATSAIGRPPRLSLPHGHMTRDGPMAAIALPAAAGALLLPEIPQILLPEIPQIPSP